MRRLVGAILVRDGKLMLGLRSPEKKSKPSTWDTIGGHVEAGESDEEALVREVGEEVGVRPVEWSLVLRTHWDEASYAIYKVTAWDGGEPRLANHEHTKLGWFSSDEAANLTPLAAEEYRALFRGLT